MKVNILKMGCLELELTLNPKMGLRWVVFKIWYIFWNCHLENWEIFFPF